MELVVRVEFCLVFLMGMHGSGDDFCTQYALTADWFFLLFYASCLHVCTYILVL